MFGVVGADNVAGFQKVILAKLAAPTIELVKPRGATTFDIDDTDPVADEIQLGLFDNLVELLPGKQPRVLTGPVDADDYVGGDSRRFYIRVTDRSAKGKKFLESNVEWWTSFAKNDRRDHGANEVQDDPPSKLSLFEVPTKPGVFVSHGLMIAADAEDRALVADSGIASGHPLFANHGGKRNDQQSNFRKRRGGMHSFVVASYTPTGSTTPVKSLPIPVFKPSSQKLLPLQVYVVRTSVGGTPSIDPDLVSQNDLLETLETFARIGMWSWTFVSASDAAKAGVTVAKATSGIQFTVAVVDPPAGVNVASLDAAGQFALGRAFPGEPNTLRIFFVSSIASGVLGESFPASVTPPPPPEKLGTSFISVAKRTPYTAPHELAHVLTNKAANGGHYTEQLSTFPRLPAVLNLMAGFPGSPGRGMQQSKRLWMVLDPGLTSSGGVPMFQISAVLGSTFTR